MYLSFVMCVISLHFVCTFLTYSVCTFFTKCVYKYLEYIACLPFMHDMCIFLTQCVYLYYVMRVPFLHNVCTCITRCVYLPYNVYLSYMQQAERNDEMRVQLSNTDKDGMTVAMLGARSGNVAIAASLMAEIEETGVSSRPSPDTLRTLPSLCTLSRTA